MLEKTDFELGTDELLNASVSTSLLYSKAVN